MKKVLLGFLLVIGCALMLLGGFLFLQAYTANVYKMGQQDVAKKFGGRIGQCAASGRPIIMPMSDGRVLVLSCEVWQTEPNEPTDDKIKI